MNTFKKSVLVALTMMMSVTLWSAEEPPAGKSSAAGKKIHRYFKFPSLLQPAHTFDTNKIEFPEKVEVLYTTDQSGRVNFVLAKTADKMLKEEIEIQFYQLLLQNVKDNVVHKVVLTFRMI